MATYTSRYGLSKPENTDEMQSFMSDYADNMDKIDENLGGGGGSANIVELTQAEYDALPASKLSDDTMYLIKDAKSASDAEFTHVYGFYIDESNKLFEGTMTNFTQTLEYTATEDAIALVDYSGSNGTNQWFLINNVIIPFQVLSSGRDSFTVPIRKGDKISARHSSDNEGCYFHLVVYGVKTGSEVTFLSEYASACYSTQEREVGCWVDGKPLYQKTIYTNNATVNNAVTISVGSLNIDSLVDIKGTYDRIVNWLSPPLHMVYCFDGVESNDEQSFIRYDKDDNNILYRIILANNEATSYQAITIRYTKTTDVAGSGQWTPMAQPTHHYSTSEQVIGTWVDGKPVYETSFPITSTTTFTSNSWVDMGINQGDMYKIIDGKLIMDYQGAYSFQNLQFGWISNKLVGNSFRNFEVEANHGYVVLQYTKSTD